jgi:chromosome segregation ATPase
MDVSWLTYDEMAAEFRLTRESARQLVIRKRWQRRKGNEDTKVRVGVPVEELQARTSDETGDDTSDATPADTSDNMYVLQVLTRHIERVELERAGIEAKLAAVESERDDARTRITDLTAELAEKAGMVKAETATAAGLRATIDAMKAALESEKQQVSDLRQQRDQLQASVTRPPGFMAWFRRSA